MTGQPRRIAIVGAGPAGLMAAETAAAQGLAVTVFDRMPSVARKFLMAGRGGLNLTHSEPLERFVTRYGSLDTKLLASIRAFPPTDAVAWAENLGQPTFVGSSGRIFPKAMKASPLLRAWLQRLRDAAVVFDLRSEWQAFSESGALRFTRPDATTFEVEADASILALGGASWPRLGSNGGWVDCLAADRHAIAPLEPANAGIKIDWSDHLKQHTAGKPLKRIALSVNGETFRGEAVITRDGLEGGAIYAANEAIRAALAAGSNIVALDLKPDLSHDQLVARLHAAPAKQSLSNVLRKAIALDAAAISLVNEREPGETGITRDPQALATRIKSRQLHVAGFANIDRAISTRGGVRFDAIDEHFMLRNRPGVFVAGEMLDWTAPTGGYLLQACLATGRSAAHGAIRHIQQHH